MFLIVRGLWPFAAKWPAERVDWNSVMAALELFVNQHKGWSAQIYFSQWRDNAPNEYEVDIWDDYPATRAQTQGDDPHAVLRAIAQAMGMEG